MAKDKEKPSAEPAKERRAPGRYCLKCGRRVPSHLCYCNGPECGVAAGFPVRERA